MFPVGLHPIEYRSGFAQSLPIGHYGENVAVNSTVIHERSSTMNILEIKGDWNITKGKLKQKWAKLTDDDLQFVEGKNEELFGRIQKRTGETREAVEKAIKEASSCCCH